MIVTVTLNTAVDKTYTVENFVLNHVHRPVEAKSTAGGKGINVARVLKELGRDVIATGFIGGCNGDRIVDGLNAEGIAHDFVRTVEESRICIAVIDAANGTQTEVNESGPSVRPEDCEALKSMVAALVPGAEALILSGSAPPGVPDDFYAELIDIARRSNVKAALDASGVHLKEGLTAGPFLVKPNVVELSGLKGREFLTREEILHSAKSLINSSTNVVIVSMGRAGCIGTDGKHAWQATPPEIPFVSAVGSGDSMLAAAMDALLSGADIPDALRVGTAAGAANAMTFGAGFLSKESVLDLKDNVHVSTI